MLFLALITVSRAGITLAHAAQYTVLPNKVHIAQYTSVFVPYLSYYKAASHIMIFVGRVN